MTNSLVPFVPENQTRLVILADDQKKLLHEALKLVDKSKIAHIVSDQFAGTAIEELDYLAQMFGDDYSDVGREEKLGFCI